MRIVHDISHAGSVAQQTEIIVFIDVERDAQTVGVAITTCAHFQSCVIVV